MSTSNRTIQWIENLAAQERLIQSGEKNTIDLLCTKDEVLVMETSSFLSDLQFHLDYLVRLFNSRISSCSEPIRIQHNENLDSIFLIRGEMKLSISRRPGAVQFQCDRSIAPERASVMFTGMVEAKFGTFHDLEWFFLGARVNSEQVARHYLTEFIQVSFRVEGYRASSPWGMVGSF